MRHEAITTTASGFTYGLTVPQFESFEEAEEAVEGGREGILEILNSDMDQNAKQGWKKPVREAVDAAEAAGFSTDELETAQNAVDDGEAEAEDFPEEVRAVLSAVTDAREGARQYVIGRPRGSTDGLTKTKSREIGAQLRDRMGSEELAALAEEHGINIEDL